MSKTTDVAVIGAGPYGLSLAAHLRGRGISHRVIGSPMRFWSTQMPRAMHLKSEGFASDLYDPKREFTLRDFCAQEGIPYADMGVPVENRTFCAYGLAFQKRFVPDLEEKTLIALDRTPDGFVLHLDSGESFSARQVVLAVGIGHFPYVPEALAGLPADLLTHSSQHSDLEVFRGREVTVIGAGASAIDVAAILHESGAHVRLVARRSELHIHDKMQLPRPLWHRIRRPMSGLGPSWKSRFFTDAPLLFYRLPESLRLRIVKTHLGPAGGWFMRDRLIGRVPLMLGSTVERASVTNGRVHLQLTTPNGSTGIEADHVIAATGYRVNLRTLHFLSDELRDHVKSVEGTPVLSTYFESSVPGLYFIGAASANSFGPLMRFAFGAGFAARRTSRHLAATLAAQATHAREGGGVPDLVAQ
ncbi:MAG TPA: NAD(P)-binding domain-containing protein [Candidatus Acidoferrales bacterium]|nr:NAD(P)-binding domain-containing protein [Candidatus Acidoferrales bacterium]